VCRLTNIGWLFNLAFRLLLCNSAAYFLAPMSEKDKYWEGKLNYQSQNLYIPFAVACNIQEIFRSVGADVEFDDARNIRQMFAEFPDGTKFVVVAGEHAGIDFSFQTTFPKFVEPINMVKAIEITMNKRIEFEKLGYIDNSAEEGDYATDRILMRKDVDTSDNAVVMNELTQILQRLGFMKRKSRQK